MLRRIFASSVLGLTMLSASASLATELTAFNEQGRNDLGEPELTLKLQDQGHELLKLRVPRAQLSSDHWAQAGKIRLDWRSCRTKDMVAGSGSLTQCVRRGFLSVLGEADRLSPALLELETLPDGRLAVHYQPEPGARSKPLRLVAETQHAGVAWEHHLRQVTQANPGWRQRAGSTSAFSGGPATAFVFFGDAGTGDKHQYRVAKGLNTYCHGDRQTCAFALMLGDNFYANGVSSINDQQWQAKFERPYAPLGLEFRAVLGNHDHQGDIQAELDYKSPNWYLPGRFYDFVDGDVGFFAIDSDDFDQEQAAWLQTKLAASPQRWKIVYGHHPVYSNGDHGDTDYLRKSLLPILKKYGADFYLSGHDHDKEVIEADGLVFVVSGGGGARLYQVDRGSGTRYASSSFGFAHLQISGDTARLQLLDQDGALQYEQMVRKPTL